MARKLAIKRLTASDLTFFEWQFKNNNAGNQKAINLNSDVFVEQLYPGLRDFDRSVARRLPVDVFIYGPGLEGELNIQRKIVKSTGSKNWRLNGEFVYNPDEGRLRFNSLEPNDFAVFDFSEGVSPESVKIIFIAGAIPEDKRLHTLFDQFLGGNKMIAISPPELETVVSNANLVKEHPIYRLTLDADTLDSEVEDIALGGSQAREKLIKRSHRNWSHDDIQRAKETADRVGMLGEQFVNDYLFKLEKEGKIHSFEWVSINNVISPYDFWVSNDGTTRTLIDVKSTEGDFERMLHVSLSELQQMSSGPEMYNIYRVFGIKDSTAQLSIAVNVGSFAKNVLTVLKDLPSGVSLDSVSFAPSVLSFETAITIELYDQPEEE